MGVEGKVKCQAKLEENEMAILTQYRNQDVLNTGKETRVLSTGECLNDLNLLGVWDHAVESARALCPTDIYVLTHKDYEATFSEKKYEETRKEMEYFARSRYDTIPTENSSWGRPVRVRNQIRIDSWRKANPLDISEDIKLRKQRTELLRRSSISSPPREDKKKRKK